ncbi:MAG: choice-of-anchor X domain-containing protein, partial [Candidatus Altimarinota bacterium]
MQQCLAGIGDTIVVTWDNRLTGDNNDPGEIVSQTVNLGAFAQSSTQNLFDNGTLGDAVAGDQIYTYSFVVPSGSIDSPSLNVSVTVTDNNGNSTTRADTSNTSYDNLSPSITTPGTIVLSNDLNNDGIAAVGDEITYAVGTEGTGDTLGATPWTVDLSAFGLSATATPGAYIILADNDDGAFTAIETVTDNAGNTKTGSANTSAITSIDNQLPVISVQGTVTLSNDVNGDGQASIGDTITYTAGTEGTGDSVGWVVDLSAFGLSASAAPGDYVVVVDNDDIAFTATETIFDNAENTTSGGVAAVGFTIIDNINPTITTPGTVTLTTDVNGDGFASIGDTITYAAGTEGTLDTLDTNPWTVDLSAYGLGVVTPGAYVVIVGDDDAAF